MINILSKYSQNVSRWTNGREMFKYGSAQAIIAPYACSDRFVPDADCLQAVISEAVPTGNDTVSVHYVLGGPDPSNTVELNVTGVFYYHNNQVGTPVAITDSERNVVWRAEYFPFGDVVDATVQTVGNHLDRRKLTGHYQDDELVLDNEGDENDASLVYMKARYYDTQIGRFYSADPIGATGEKGSANQDYAYSYVGNNPINRFDPTGLTWETNFYYGMMWLYGYLPNENYYYEPNIETQEMQNSPGADAMRHLFYEKGNYSGWNPGGHFWFYVHTVVSPYTADWSSTALQVGGFKASARENPEGTVTYTIDNISRLSSLLGIPYTDVPWKTGPMSNVKQVFTWTEPIMDQDAVDEILMLEQIYFGENKLEE